MGKNVVEFSILAKDNFSSQFARMRGSINKTAKIAAGFGIAAAGAFGVAAKALIDVGDKTESLRLRMDAMLGSVEEGGLVFEDMTKFASEVPFAYEDIMASATQLSGVMENGRDEINKWMPMIADLASVSGLSIEKTTEQVVRMYSAGAGAADLFRERGITAMLGFQAGVSISAEDTRKKLIEAFESPESKFRGASMKMAKTWSGLMSMMGDKWFAMKDQLNKAGLFNYFKALATVIDGKMGDALKNTKDNAGVWANTIIDGIRSVSVAVGQLVDMFVGIKVVWLGLELAFAVFAEATIISIYKIIEGWRLISNMIPGIKLGKFEDMESLLGSMSNRTNDIKNELVELAQQELPSVAIENFTAKVEAAFTALQESSESTQNNIKTTAEISAEAAQFSADEAQSIARANALINSELIKQSHDESVAMIESLGISTDSFATQFQDVMASAVSSISSGIASAIVEGKNMADIMQNIGKQLLKQMITMLIKLGIQKTIFASTNIATILAETKAATSAAIGLAGANGVASMAFAPFPINATAPAFGLAMMGSAASAFTTGAAIGSGLGATVIAHGGFTNVPKEATYFLDEGERVLSPKQNEDLTAFLANTGSGGGGGGSTNIENINIDISVGSLNEMTEDDLEEFVAGKLIRTLDKLDDDGVRQRALERSNA